jgi:hypothetical protein
LRNGSFRSGKSTLINGTLYPILNAYYFNGVKKPQPYKKKEGLDLIDKVNIDQSPIGRTPRSNPQLYRTIYRSQKYGLPESMIGVTRDVSVLMLKADAAKLVKDQAYERLK